SLFEHAPLRVAQLGRGADRINVEQSAARRFDRVFDNLGELSESVAAPAHHVDLQLGALLELVRKAPFVDPDVFRIVTLKNSGKIAGGGGPSKLAPFAPIQIQLDVNQSQAARRSRVSVMQIEREFVADRFGDAGVPVVLELFDSLQILLERLERVVQLTLFDLVEGDADQMPGQFPQFLVADLCQLIGGFDLAEFFKQGIEPGGRFEFGYEITDGLRRAVLDEGLGPPGKQRELLKLIVLQQKWVDARSPQELRDVPRVHSRFLFFFVVSLGQFGEPRRAAHSRQQGERAAQMRNPVQIGVIKINYARVQIVVGFDHLSRGFQEILERVVAESLPDQVERPIVNEAFDHRRQLLFQLVERRVFLRLVKIVEHGLGVGADQSDQELV